MATTPHADSHKNHTHDAKAAPAKAPQGKAAAPKDGEPAPPTLDSDSAWSLFYNGHRIAKQGDTPDKWISMRRLADGLTAVVTPLTSDMEAEIRAGEYYLADEGAYTAPPPAPGLPTNVDIPYVSVTGAIANCTTGNWTNEPTSYAYAWQRNGIGISGASAANYTMVAVDKGAAIGCIVSASNAAGGPVAAPLSNTVVGP